MASNPFDDLDQQASLDANPFEKLDHEAANPPSAGSKVGSRIADIGLSTLKGAIGVPEAMVGVADLVTGGEAGQIAEQLGFRPKEAKETLDTLYSDPQKAANKAVADAEGFFPTVGKMIENPSTILHQTLESVPSMLPGAAVARGVMAVAPKVGPILAGAMGEGVVAAGQGAEQVRQQDPNGNLSLQQAAIIAASGAATGAIGFGGGQLANKLGIGDASTMLAAGRVGAVGDEAIQAGASKGILRKIGEGAVAEGVLQEMPQSFQEQAAHNLALGKPWDEGTAEAAAQGMLAGGLMGAVAGPLSSAAPRPAPVDDTAPATDPLNPAAPGAVPPAVPPAGPLSAAAAMVAPRAGEAKLFPFSDMAMAQKQADALSQSTGTPHEAADHPSVPGRFAATPVAIRGSDPLFTAEAERQGLDPATAQLLTQGAQSQALVKAAMAANPDIDPQQWRDPAVRAQLGAAHLKRQVGELESALERTPTPAEAYIAQLVGVPTAAQMLTMPEAERGMPVSSLIPDPAQEDALGVTGMPVGEAINFLTQQADKALTTLKEQGNANLATDIPSAGSGNRGPAAGAGVGNPVGNDAVPAGRAGGTGADAAAMPDVSGNNGNDAGRAGPVAAPRVVVGPSDTGFLNVNAQRHRDNADQMGVTPEIERLFGDGLTVNQVVGQMQDKLPSMLPADVPNFVNGVRGTLGIPSPITPEGKGAFDAWRSEYKARLSAPPAPNNAGAAKVTLDTIAPQNDVDLAAHESSNSPLNERSTATPGQVDANNYKVGRAEVHGLKVGIENPKGSLRSGFDTDGKPWSTLMTAHYGRFTGTKGADGDAVDTFIGGQPDSPRVFVIDQIDPKTGKFDEHKVILGVNSQQEALDLYNDNYAPGWQGAKAVSETTPETLKTWLKMGDTTAEFASVATPAATPERAGELAKQWDYANRSNRSSEWIAGAAESNRAFEGVDGSTIPAHGMAKASTLSEGLKNLTNLLNGGIDPDRTLYYDSLTNPNKGTGAATGTAGGTAYRDGPFIVTFREGLNGRQPTAEDITGVLVNPVHQELVAPLQEMFPNLTVRSYGDAADVVAASKGAQATPTGTTTSAETAAPARVWQDSPFAPRIQSMLDTLNAAGDTGMASAIEAGVEMDAKQGRLAEDNIAFRENKARVAVNTLTNAGQPVAVEPLTFEQFAERNNTVGALPREIGEAALARWNEIAPKLAALGYKDGEVDSRHPKEAQDLQRQMKDVLNALNGLAPRRYQSAREHKNFNPESLERDEDKASEVLGINTRLYPGINTDSKITLGQGVVAKPGAASPVAAEPTGTTTPAPAVRKFTFGGVSHVDAKLPAALVEKVQQALDSRADSYRVQETSDSTRINLPNGGQLVVDKDGNARLMGDDQYGWASTMSAASAQRTLKNWLKDMGPAPAAPAPTGFTTPNAQQTGAELADLKGGEPIVKSQQEMQQHLQNYSKAGKDEQGRQVYRSFNDAGEHEIVVDKDGRIVRDFGVVSTYDLDDKRSVELSYNTLTAEWRATEYGSDNKPVKSVPLSEQDVQRTDREGMLGEKFGADKVEELTQLAARSPAREWAMRPDARKRPGFNRKQFESDLTGFDASKGSSGPASESRHKELGKKLADPANYMAAVDQLPDLIAQLDREIADTQAKLDKNLDEQDAAEKHNGNGWVFVNRIAVGRRMLASLTETRDSLATASKAGAPATDAVLVEAEQLEIPKPSAQQNKEAALKVLASPYFAVDGLTYQIDKGSETQGGETIWAGRAFPEGATAPAGIFGKSIHSFVEHDGKLWRTDSVDMENVRLAEVTLLDQPLPVDPNDRATGYAKSTAPAKKQATAVNYPNRKLGFQKAASDDDAKYDDKAWANIAAANMRVGDTFQLNGKQTTVQSITEKTLTLVQSEKKGTDRKKRVLNPDGVAWAQFQRDLGGQIGVENLQAKNILKPKRPLIDILKRDPAVHVDANGSVFLRDGGVIDVDGAAAPATPAAKPEQKPALKQGDIPAELVDFFNKGTSSTTLTPYEEKLARALLAWGYTIKDMPTNMFGRPSDTLRGMEIGLSAGDEQRIRLMVTTSKAPNGKWGVGITIRAPRTGSTEGAMTLGPQFDTRLAALEYGMAQWRDGALPELKGTRESDAGYIDKAFAKMEAQLAEMQGKATKGESPDTATAVTPDAPDGGTGEWGSVYAPMKFVSGMTRPGDFKRLFGEDRNVGIQVGELNGPTPAQIGAAMEKSKGWLFVDSGAFPAYQSNKLAFLKALEKGFADWKGEKILSFDQILEKYEALHRAIGEADDSGTASERVFFVMPDVVGRQKDSLELVGEYRSAINGYGDHAILPLQVGELSLTQAYESAMISLLKDPNNDSGPMIGIPSAKEAAPNDQLTALLKKHGDRIPGVHVLGNFADKTLAPRLAAIREAGYTGNVSADANRLRSLMYGERNRPEAWEALLAETTPDSVKAMLDDNADPDVAARRAAAEKWGYTEDTLPRGAGGRALPVSMGGTKPILEFDNKRFGKEQLSFTVNAVETPNGKFAAGLTFKAGGQTEQSASGHVYADFASQAHDSRSAAVTAMLETLKGKVPESYWGAINAQQTAFAKKEKDAAERAKDPVIPVRQKPGFATMEQENQRVDLLAGLAQANGMSLKTAADKAARLKAIGAATRALAKVPAGRLTLDGALQLKDMKSTADASYVDSVRGRAILAPEYISLWVENRTTADLDTAYAEYEKFANGKPLLAREYFAQVLAGQTKAAKPGLKKMQDAKAATTEGFVKLGDRADGTEVWANAAGTRQKRKDGKVIGEFVHSGAFDVGSPSLNARAYMTAAELAAAKPDYIKLQDAKPDAPDTPAKRDSVIRGAQRQAYQQLGHHPELLAVASGPLDTFTASAQKALGQWVKDELAAAASDPARQAELRSLQGEDGSPTLPQEFYASLHKYAQRNAREAAKAAARDPAVYKQALLDATVAAGLPVDPDQVALFMAGWDHALAGKTKSTLMQSELVAKGYEAAQQWVQTDAGSLYYSGKQAKKLQNTGEDLRRWFDEASRKVKDASAGDLAATYEAIKDQMSRVRAFANLAAAGATPGTTRYINDVRDTLIPFQEWLLSEGRLRSMGGRYSSDETDSGKIAGFLNGERYASKNELGNEDYAGRDATPEQRLELLQAEAARYMEALRQVAGAMQGAASVTEAAAGFTKLMVADQNESHYSIVRLTSAGKALRKFFRYKKYTRYETGMYYTTEAIRAENTPDAPSNSKTPLVPPKLDRVVREGLADHRKGANVTPEQLKATFGLADVGFGKYVKSKQDQDHLNYAYDAFMDLAQFLKVDPTAIGLGRKLHFTIGALGHGKAAAHFSYGQPDSLGKRVTVINLTNTRGDGTVAHEWFHALDHALSQGYEMDGSGKGVETWTQHYAIKKVLAVLTKHYNIAHARSNIESFLRGETVLGRKFVNRTNDKARIANAKEGIDYYEYRFRTTVYKSAADKLGESYWGNPRELIARAAEAYVHDRMEGMNNYLVNPEWVGDGKVTPPKYKGTPYPQGEERVRFAAAFDALVKSLRFSADGVTVDMTAFNAALPDGVKEYREAVRAIEAELPAMLAEQQKQERARRLELDELQAEQQRVKDEVQRIAYEARIKAEMEAAAPPPVATGPLSDEEIDALLDAAEAQLAEQSHNEPATPEPGAVVAAAAERWTREDYQHIREQVEQGQLVVFANEKWAEEAGLPTLGSLQNMAGASVRHMGYGVFEVTSPAFTGNFTGGGSMSKTPGGQSYTTFSTTSGAFPYPADAVSKFLNAKLIVKSGPKAAPTVASHTEKTAQNLIAEAAKLGVKGIDEALRGLVQLFGGPHALRSFPSGMDKESYDKAKPHFAASLKAFQEAGKTLQELFVFLFQQLGPGARPYIKHFTKEMAIDRNLGAAAPAPGPDAVTIENSAPVDNTDETTEEKDDPAIQGSPAALDTPLDGGPATGAVRPTDPIRGAGISDSGDGQPDGRGVPGRGQRADGEPDAPQPLGSAGGDAGVSHPAPDGVGGNPKPLHARDFRAGLDDLTRTGSWRDTAARNVDLIELARKIDAEQRIATPAEQAQLARYVGFGAGEIRNRLFPVPSAYAKRQDPTRLIFPNEIADPLWKPLAERLAALPREWQQSVLQSTQYAHYTSAPMVRAIWSAVERLGFTGGKVLEPGMGIGSFPMLMPDNVRTTSKYTGIEFDGPTALIARLLSPQQNVLHEDFIKRRLPKNYFDLAIGNPPFSKTAVVADPEYAKHNFALHDYFFAKSMDRVRPGGLLVFVTSHYTMDKASDKARKYLAERADLVGAIRLPQTAFKDNAGTTVVTDVLFLRKRLEGEVAAGKDWNTLDTLQTKDGPTLVNRYFVEHPEMIMGQPRLSGSHDDMGRRVNGLRGSGEFTVVSYDRDMAELEAKVAAAVKLLPANVYSLMTRSPESIAAETAKFDFNPAVKREGVVYLDKKGEVMRVTEGVGKPLDAFVKLSAKDKQWLRDYVGLRDLVRAAQQAQFNDSAWEKPLKQLNTAYDKFRKTHGPVLDFTVQTRTSTDEDGHVTEVQSKRYKNTRLFSEDYDASIVKALEQVKEDGSVVKGPFLLDRSIGKPVTRDIKTVGDALAVSLDERGQLDLDDVARRIGLSRDDTIEALGSQVYETPQGGMELADAYLSGDVVAKLEEARMAARDNPALERNVAALMAVQPPRLGPSQITVKLGASWVPLQHVNAFSFHIGSGEVMFDRKTESWQVDGGNERNNRSAAHDFGTAARSPNELLEAVLNSRTIVIKYGTGAGKELAGKTDPEATTAANETAKKIRDEFKSWVWQDSDRAAELVELYNTIANNIAPRVFNGDHLTLPGVSLRYKLFPHQKRAIWRVIQTGNTYLAHAVGAGKTIEMVAAAMEQKRIGLIKKPMFVVPNHMLDQFANEFMELYPLANIMVADDKNFSAEKRRSFVTAATLNAPDAIILTHSSFKLIGVREESIAPIRARMIGELEDELAEVAKDSGQRVRRSQLEQQIEAINQRFDKVLGMSNKDGTVTFEDIGVDQVIVDEAHAFRKLDFSTNQSIKGIDPNGSQAALGLYVKTRYLESKNPGRALVFASGTPVTNTMGELYTVMRYFDPVMMEEMGISTFDGWARMFGEVATSLEPNATGRYENVERFAKFSNIPELMSRVRQFMDVLNSEHLGALVKRPDIEGGKPELIVVPGSPALKQYMENVLTPRLERSRKWKPSKSEPHNPDPVLNIITDGKFAALDPRFFGGAVGADTPTKLNRMAEEIIKEYHATAGEVFVDKLDDPDAKTDPVKGGTQIVFYNLGFGASAKTNRGFDARGTMTQMLVKGGVKRDQIAWFDDANTDAKKEAVFKAMRAGHVRILIGSAKKMGTGVNVQKRLSALHYFDPPWYPSDIEQPHGRIIRQGNQHGEVRIKWYSTKGTYDETMWQMVARKQRFIDQAFSGDASIRSMDDLSEASLYEQAAALSSGDPRAIQLAGLRQDVERLERLQAAHSNEQVNLRGELRRASWEQEYAEKQEKTLAEAFKVLGGQHVSFTSGKVDGRNYDSATDFGEALKAAFNAHYEEAMLASGGPVVAVAELPGITLHLAGMADNKGHATGIVGLWAVVGPKPSEMFRSEGPVSDTAVSGVGLTRSIYTMANSISRELDKTRAVLVEQATKIARLSKKVGAPFGQMQEMVEKNAELLQLEAELRADGQQANVPVVQVTPDGDITLDGKAPANRSVTEGLRTGPKPQRRNTDRARRSKDTPPLFARTQQDDAGAVTGKAQPIGDAAIDGVINRVQAAFAAANGAALPVRIQKVRDMGDLPSALQEAGRRQQVGELGKGVFYEGVVYVVQDAHSTAEQVETTIFHELYGHAATSALFGSEWAGKLNGLLKAVGGAGGIIRLAEANGVNLQAYMDGLAADETLTDDLRRAALMDELLAHIAEKKTVFRKLINEFIGSVRNWLRVHGFAQLAEYGNTDLAYLLAQGRRALAARATGAPAPRMPVFARDDAPAPVFYSVLAERVAKLPMKTAPAQQWAATIRGMTRNGVKAEEIEWSGVLDWLNMPAPGTKISKDAVRGYLLENGVRVNEMMRGTPVPMTPDGLALRKAVFDQYQTQIDAASVRAWDYTLPSREQDEAHQEMEELMTLRDREADAAYTLPDDETPDSMYSQYSLPGGVNYREILLTLPAKAQAMDLRSMSLAQWHKAKYHAEFPADLDIRRELTAEYLRDKENQRRDRESAGYTSNHWDGEANVLAHVRFNDRTASDGSRVLFIEEIQSDWAQEGKKAGFEGVPRGPFVGNTDAWVSLAVKRMIRYAAENGYDKVAVISGQQGVERFLLNKQVRQVRVVLRQDGRYSLFTTPDDPMAVEMRISDRTGLDAEGLADFIGSDLSRKAIADLSPANPQRKVEDELPTVTYKGLDLNVGGEGMRTFYDQIVPNIVNDVLKKLGGGRVQPVELAQKRGAMAYFIDAEDNFAADDAVQQEVIVRDNVSLEAVSPVFQTLAAAKQWLAETDANAPRLQQQGFTITPELRAQAMGGLPLFKRDEKRAPNGRASNLPPHLWHQVRTPEFKAWFGDWEKNPTKASRVVDENGEPRVVYHGTRADFDVFDKTKIRFNSLGGFWFAERSDYTGNLGGVQQPGFNQMPVFLNVRKPVDSSRFAMARKDAESNQQVQRRIKDMGGDGVRLNNGSDSVWIATEPTQIKSATANNGNFDAGHANILFSRSAAAISRQAGSAIKQVTVTDVKNKLVDYRGIGLQALGRRQIMDLYGDLFPQGTKENLLETYNKLAMQMDADKNEAGAEADTIATNWAKLADESELAELMHDATRLQIDPSKPFVLGDIKRDYTDLAARYKALSPAARKIFHDASKAYTKHYDAVRAAVHERIVRAMPGHPNQAAMLTKMDAEFFGQIKGIYFPLARFGEYMVQVKWSGANPPPGAQPAREAIHFAETMAKAEALRAELLTQYPASKGYLVNKVTRRAEYNAGRDSVGRGFLQELFNMFKSTGMDPSLQDAINQLYLTSLPDLSWAKHGIHRKGTPGFSQDARRAFANHMFHGARYLAKLNYADQMSQSIDDMQHYTDAHAQDADYDQVKAQQVVDEMLKRHDIYMNPKTSPLSTALTSFGFVFYLGLSPASAAVNLSQTALVAYPILGARYGFAKAGAALLEASKVALQGHNDLGKVLTGDELVAYQGWVKSGVIDVSMAHDLAGVAQGEDHKMFGQMRKVMKVASYMFHHAERFNRQATALAAYRLARGAGLDHDAASDAAVKDTYAGHFDYAAGNRPRLMQGDVARVVLLFKQYAQNMIYTFGRNAALAFKGDKQALKTLSGLLVSHAMAAGALGLPVVGTLLAVASALGSSDDEPWDAEIALRNMLAETFGNKVGEVLAHGMSRLTPWDLSSRVGLNQLLLPDFQEGLEGGRMAESVITRLLGPIAGVGVNFAKGAHSMAEGHWQRGFEQMLPVALRGPLKAIRYEQEGVRDITGVELLPETTAAENIGQALGFSPGRGREAQEGKSAIYQTDRALQSRRQELMTDYAEKLMNQEDPSDTVLEIRAFNQLHPNRMIAPLHLQQSVRARLQRKAQAQQGVFLPARRSDARAAGQFASELPE